MDIIIILFAIIFNAMFALAFNLANDDEEWMKNKKVKIALLIPPVAIVGSVLFLLHAVYTMLKGLFIYYFKN